MTVLQGDVSCVSPKYKYELRHTAGIAMDITGAVFHVYEVSLMLPASAFRGSYSCIIDKLKIDMGSI